MAFFFQTPGEPDDFPARPDLILSPAAASRQTQLRRERSRLARRAVLKLLGIERPALFPGRPSERHLRR